jgi:hypothetical protein
MTWTADETNTNKKAGRKMSVRETLVTHPNGRCYGHLEWGPKGTTLVVDHCECEYAGAHPSAGCGVCGATDIPLIGHAEVCRGER